MRRAAVLLAFVVLAIAVGIALFGHAIASAIVADVAGAATGTRVSFATMRLSTSEATFTGLRVRSRSGEPIATIARLDVTYDLRDLLPGSTRKYGLRGIVLDDPQLTLIRHSDGTLNVPLPKASTGTSGGPPLRFRLVVRDGGARFVNEKTGMRPASVAIGDVGADVRLDTSGTSTYEFAASYLDRSRRYPMHGAGAIDVAQPFTLDRVWAPRIPIADLVNAVLQSNAIRVESGELDGLDVDVFGEGTVHAGGSVRLRGASVAVSALSAPISQLQGDVEIADDAIATADISGRIAGIEAHLRGGVFDLKHPQAHVALAANGELATVRRLARAARSLPPVSGPVALRVLLEGPALAPTAFVSIASPRLLYNGVSFAGTRTLLAATTHEIDVVGAQTRYGAITLGASGTIALAQAPNAMQLFLHGSAPAASLPFVAGITPGMVLHAATLATADAPRRIALRGFIRGQTSAQSASALFSVNSNGVGVAGPMLVQGSGGRSLYARIAIDHPRGSIVALARATRFALHPAAPVALGNFRIPSVPQLRGTLDGSALGTQEHGGGVVRVRNGAFRQDGRTWLANLDATIGMQSGTIAVYGARARVAGGEALAGGRMGHGGSVAFLLSGARIEGVPIGGAGSLALARDTIAIRNVLLQAGPAIVSAQGSVDAGGAHALDLHAGVRGLDLADAASVADAKVARDVTGSADADLRIAGPGAAPRVSGSIDVPEGSLDGEGFTGLRFGVAGGDAGIALTGGRLALGSSPVAFDGYVSRASSRVRLDAPRLDLADLNDFFDTGDMFEGTGHLDVALAYDGSLSTSGNAAFHGAYLRQYDLGETTARWSTTAGTLHVLASSHSPTAVFAIRGDVAGAPFAPDVDLTADAHDVALGSWVPSLSLRVPIEGTANATVTVRGRYPAMHVRARANVVDAMAGRIPIRSASVTAALDGRRGTIESASLQMAYLSARASGTFGLEPDAPFDLHGSASSSDVGRLAQTVTGKTNPLGGAAQTTLSLTGTMRDPSFGADMTLQSLRYRGFVVPRVRGEIVARRTSIVLRGGEADLARGRLLARGRIPLARNRFSLAGAPLQADVTANDVALANFAALLPKGTQLGGQLDGSVAIGGTAGAPSMNGTLRLAGGSYVGPFDRTPLDGISGELALHGTSIALRSLRANAGGGTLSGSGAVDVPNFLSPAGASFTLAFAANGARVDSPQYFNGQVDARVAVKRSPGTPIDVAGYVHVSHATIPMSALYHPSSSKQPPPKLPPIAFSNVGIQAGPDVRIENSSVNVGGAGKATLSGTLAAPVMDGVFHATGGTVNFYQLFRVERARVTFDPADGLTPQIDAVAATSIASPPTDVRIHVTGPATNMHLGLSSSPSYDRSQILGLLVGMQSFGAVQGVPSDSTPFTASSTFRRIGFAQANGIFTRSILAPISNTVGGALGTQNLQLYSNFGVGYGTGIGASVVKRIAQHVSVTTSANFGYPWQEMVKFQYERRNATAVALSVYQQQQTFLNSTPPGLQQSPSALNLQPSSQIIGSASSGVLVTFERRYWSCALFHYCLSCSHC